MLLCPEFCFNEQLKYMEMFLNPIEHSHCTLCRKDSLFALCMQVLHEQKGWVRGRWVGSTAA